MKANSSAFFEATQPSAALISAKGHHILFQHRNKWESQSQENFKYHELGGADTILSFFRPTVVLTGGVGYGGMLEIPRALQSSKAFWSISQCGAGY